MTMMWWCWADDLNQMLLIAFAQFCSSFFNFKWVKNQLFAQWRCWPADVISENVSRNCFHTFRDCVRNVKIDNLAIEPLRRFCHSEFTWRPSTVVHNSPNFILFETKRQESRTHAHTNSLNSNHFKTHFAPAAGLLFYFHIKHQLFIVYIVIISSLETRQRKTIFSCSLQHVIQLTVKFARTFDDLFLFCFVHSFIKIF